MSDADSDFFPAALHAGRSLDRLLDDTNGDSSSVRHIEMNIVIRDLLPDRVLRVTAIDLDEYALKVRYKIIPPVNPRLEGVSEGSLLQYAWYLAGRDDLGNQYDSGGGAYGLAADGQSTEGVHSLIPVPAASASWLDIAFYTDTAAGSQDPFESARYVLRIELPIAGP